MWRFGKCNFEFDRPNLQDALDGLPKTWSVHDITYSDERNRRQNVDKRQVEAGTN